MKKTFSLLILVLITVLCGCGDAGSEGNKATIKPTTVPTIKLTQSPSPVPTPTQAPTTEPTANAGIAADTNLALNCTYEVSSTTGEMHVQWGWAEEYINDGNTENEGASHVGWTSGVGINMDKDSYEDYEEYVWFDLGAWYNIDEVILYPAGAMASFFPIDYHIEVSNDDKNYTTVANVQGDLRTKNGDTTPSKVTFEVVKARYVRCVFTLLYDVPSQADGYLCQLAEIEVLAA